MKPVNSYTLLAIATAAAIGINGAHGATSSGYTQYRNATQSEHGPASATYHEQRRAQGNQYGLPPATQHPHYSAGTIKKYVKAYKAVETIARHVERELKGTHSTKKMQKIRMATQNKMIHAVKQSGLSVPKYNEIEQAMKSDAQLRARIQKMAG